jgi:hypothetical protein
VLKYSPASQQSVVNQYKDGGKNFQGLWLSRYSPHESFDADAVKITTYFVGQVEEDASVKELFSETAAIRFWDYTPTNSFQQGNHMLFSLSDCRTRSKSFPLPKDP